MRINKLFNYILQRNKIWLPIINESGTVFGKITYGKSLARKNKFLHPIVRIALIHNGRIFLCEKKDIETHKTNCLDYPFERHVLYKETLDAAVEKTFESNGSKQDLLPNCTYLFHYIFRSEKIERLVFFYVCYIHDDSSLKKINLCKGKWWMHKQIKENLNTGLFSLFFENEFKFLESTVLAID